MALERLQASLRLLQSRRARVLGELHPELRARVMAALDACDGRLALWEGFRNEADQNIAFKKGKSQARWGESPHNYLPSLAVDVVLNPKRVRVGPHPDDSRYPNLWDSESPDAVAAWAALERAALTCLLGRVTLKHGRDLPHLELPDWRERAGLTVVGERA